MPKMLAVSAGGARRDVANGFPGPSSNPGAILVTMMLLGCLETPANFAMVFGMIALGLRN